MLIVKAIVEYKNSISSLRVYFN